MTPVCAPCASRRRALRQSCTIAKHDPCVCPHRRAYSSPAPGGKGCQELCSHLLFVMCKVLRVPPSNPLVWQLSLTGAGETTHQHAT